jgi:hypothetical protein
MVIVATPVAAAPALVHGGVSLAGLKVTVNVFD